MSHMSHDRQPITPPEEEEVPILELKEKLQHYSEFIDKTLHPDLQAAVKLQEEIESEIDEYNDLSSQLTILHNRHATTKQDQKSRNANDDSHNEINPNNNPTTTLVDLGNKICYCHATFDNPLKVHVHIGMGFHAELTLQEAHQFCQKRIEFLHENVLPSRQKKTRLIASHLEGALVLVQNLRKEILEMEANIIA